MQLSALGKARSCKRWGQGCTEDAPGPRPTSASRTPLGTVMDVVWHCPFNFCDFQLQVSFGANSWALPPESAPQDIFASATKPIPPHVAFGAGARGNRCLQLERGASAILEKIWRNFHNLAAKASRKFGKILKQFSSMDDRLEKITCRWLRSSATLTMSETRICHKSYLVPAWDYHLGWVTIDRVVRWGVTFENFRYPKVFPATRPGNDPLKVGKFCKFANWSSDHEIR